MKTKTVVWAVATTTIGITGKRECYVDVRTVKTPRLNMVYFGAQVPSFDAVLSCLKDPSTCEIRYAKQYNKWNDKVNMMEWGEVIELKAPDAMGKRGYYICEECGNKTRSVLDGEAWCDNCGRYQ